MQLISRCLVALPLILALARGYTQTGNYFSVGETGLFDVIQTPGISYCWTVTENLSRQKTAGTDKVTYLTPACNSAVQIKWEKTGTYFLTVTGFNEHGCSNTKIFPVFVTDNHAPVANDDYFSATWLNSLRIDLLRNDRDSNNDMDTSTLQILTKPEFGTAIAGKNGIVTYHPLPNRPGKERFSYRICDFAGQCDSAIVFLDLKDPPIHLPEAISPNGDGLNDCFAVRGLEAFPNSSLIVFGRDGIIVYRNDNYQNDWNGWSNAKKHYTAPLPPGTYYYVLRLGNTSGIIKGFIYLIR